MTLDVFGSYRIVNNQIRANLQKLLVEGKHINLKIPRERMCFMLSILQQRKRGIFRRLAFIKVYPGVIS